MQTLTHLTGFLIGTVIALSYPMTVGALQITVPLKDTATQPAVPDASQFWGEEGFSFSSFLDIINPLQQLPVVSTLYRDMTGDTISSGSRLAGGALYGGPIGFAVALFNEILKSATGHDVGESALAMAKGEQSMGETHVASNESFMSPNQRAAYNSYVSVQNLTA